MWTRVKKSFNGKNPLANYKENAPVPLPRQKKTHHGNDNHPSDARARSKPVARNRGHSKNQGSYDNPNSRRKPSSSSHLELLNNDNNEVVTKPYRADINMMKTLPEIPQHHPPTRGPQPPSTQEPIPPAPRRTTSAKQNSRSAKEQSHPQPQVINGSDHQYASLPLPGINIVAAPEGESGQVQPPALERIYDTVPKTPEQRHKVNVLSSLTLLTCLSL